MDWRVGEMVGEECVGRSVGGIVLVQELMWNVVLRV